MVNLIKEAIRGIRLVAAMGALLLLSGGCGGNGDAEGLTRMEEERVRELAQPVAGELVKTLEGRLKTAMKSGGPPAAIRVCAEEAQQLTRAVEREAAIAYLKRVGVRIRNQENAPDQWEAAALDFFTRGGTTAGGYPADYVQEVTGPDGLRQIRYYKAIPTQARCLLCHGGADNIPASVRSVLDAQYPEDRARGFAEGDLRGLLVVGLDPEKLAVE